MAKKLKMVLYGEPGVGKSVFACKAPKPFFITTDGNYEWLEDFGAKEEDHIQVNSWEEAKKAFKQDFSNYETVVVDLTEDLFKWCEYEFCKRNKIEHVNDLGYGKGYDMTRNEFFIEICKLIGLDKHVIFIMHGGTQTVKDRRGVEHTKYVPSTRLPDKLLDMLEGRVRYFLRCYLKAETLADGKVIKKRYLSLIPKENEFGIHRGVDEATMPQDINLDFDLFAECIGLYDKKGREENKKIEKKVETPKEEVVIKKPNGEKEILTQMTIEEVKEEPEQEIKEEVKEEVIPETKPEVKKEETVQEENKKELTQAEKIAAIKAKLAAKKKGE